MNMRKSSFTKKFLTKVVAAVVFATIALVGFNAKTASAGPAQSISQLDIVAYGYDSWGSGRGWKSSYTGTITRDNLHDLWVNTFQTGYGSVDCVKIDGSNVSYTDDKKPYGSGVINNFTNSITITDNSYVKSLSSGRHTITVQCSSRNTFPSRTVSDSVSFNVE